MAEHDVDREKLLDHDYDGIRELDNLLPRWWLGLFYASIVFAGLYLAYYHVLRIGYLQEDEYRREMNPNYRRQTTMNPVDLLDRAGYHSPWYSPERDRTRQALLAGQAMPAAEAAAPVAPIVFTEPLTDGASLEAGKTIYARICVQCHEPQGQGKIGPNLTDNYWLHGDQFADTVQVVVNGVIEKGMQSWRKQLSPEQIHQVSSYVYSLRGTSPPNPKPPEGKAY
jgi:cytochrome c oxidase cbb3-type subunit 3